MLCGVCLKEFEGYRCTKYCSPSCVKVVRKQHIRNYRNSHLEVLLLKAAKVRALKKNLEFNISSEDVKIPDFCPVLGIPLFTSKTGKSGFFANSPSIDRKNPNKGYTKDNIRVISCRANLLKSNASVEEMEKVLLDLKALSCV